MKPAFFSFPIDPPVALIRQLPFLPFPYPVEEKGADLKGSNLSSHHTIQQKKGGVPAAQGAVLSRLRTIRALTVL